VLTGISLGPGDPGLLTLKAAEALKRCQKVFVPGEMAAELSRPYCRPEILKFPMVEDPAELEAIWTKNADIIAEVALQGEAGFACIGDVSTFSTFTHLRRVLLQRHPSVGVEAIAGVGAVPALASRFGIGLDRSFTVSDGSEVDMVIRMKATRPRKMAEDLKQKGFDEFILGIKLCTPEEKVIRGCLGDLPEKSDYFSVLYARRKR
jgi:precorrin-2/cobalt-factor-2 C20-methyltransferase